MAWAFMLLSAIPHEAAVRDYVDLIEINHFYDEQGRLVFTQAIFYHWDLCDASKKTVIAWRIVNDRRQLPRYDHIAGVYRCIWQDGEVIRNIETLAVVETWTQYDVELLAREDLPKEHRRELTSDFIMRPQAARRRLR